MHKDGAAVTENRHSLRRKSEVGELIYAKAETFGGGLKEISVSRGALCIEFEIFYAAVVQNDDLDVLAAHVHNHVRVFVKLQRRFGVRNRLDQRDIGLENIFQDVLGIAGCCDAQNLQFGVLRFHLAAQVLEHLNRVLDRVPV